MEQSLVQLILEHMDVGGVMLLLGFFVNHYMKLVAKKDEEINETKERVFQLQKELEERLISNMEKQVLNYTTILQGLNAMEERAKLSDRNMLQKLKEMEDRIMDYIKQIGQ